MKKQSTADKNYIAKDDFLKDVLVMLRETFEGSPEGQGSAYLDRGIGVFPTIEMLSAEQVSKEINDITIAAHTEHFKFYLDRLCEFIKGRTEPVNWEQSWLIDEVNDEEWNHLREGMKRSYEGILHCLANISDWNEEKTGMAMGILAHTAYHLGAIRQLVKSIN